MKRFVTFIILLLGMILGPLVYAEPSVASSPKKPNYNPKRYDWLDTPWRVRYLIRVSRLMPAEVRGNQARNEKADQKGDPEFRQYIPYFTPTIPLTAEQQEALAQGKDYTTYTDAKGKTWASPFMNARMGFLVIEFDKSGKVITPQATGKPLVGKTGDGYDSSTGEHFRRIYLVEGDASPGSNWSLVANWFEGFRSGAGREVSPALCDFYIDSHRYQAQANPLRVEKYDMDKVEEDIGLTGCREWAWQRNRSVQEQPYFDVSSHPSPSWIKKSPNPRPFIAEVLGWGGFDDPLRPVIGMYAGQWQCLHDCPDGESPGVIDIKEWTAKRGWPMPKPLPFFPDSKFRGRNAD